MLAVALALLVAAAGEPAPLPDPLPATRGEGASPATPPLPPTTSPTPTPPPTPTRPRAATLQLTAIPIVSYGSDVGLQLGGAAYLYELDAAGNRGDWGALGISWTERGPRSVELKGELLGIGGTSLRTFAQVKASLDTRAPYWGEGAALGGLPIAPGAGSPPPPFAYRATAPWVSLVLRGALAGPFGWWTRLRYTEVAVTEPGAALAAAAPPGARGARSTLLHAGVVYDTRDRTSSPRVGWLADASVFGSAPGPLASQAMGGANAGARGYFPLWEGAVLAARALYDLKLGDVPFFERSLYEGLSYGEGLGGAGTIRGLARDRLSGEEKVLVGTELRTWLAETWWLGRHQQWGLSAGVDGGRSRDRGHVPVFGLGGFGGLRVLLQQAVVVRLEVGFAGQGALGYYLSFDEAF